MYERVAQPVPQPDSTLVKAVIAQIETKRNCVSKKVDFSTRNVELNEGSWNSLMEFGDIFIGAEYGENPESGDWSIIIGVKRGYDTLLTVHAYGTSQVHFRDAEYRASCYVAGDWEQELMYPSN